MAKEIDTNKAVRQHLEMADFFTGFVVKGARANDYEALHPSDEQVSAPVPQAARSDNSADSAAALEAIAVEVRPCCKCALSETRTNAVPGEGNPNARLMFVGEAPGADEDAQGRPFVGRAGQLLDKIITACGLKREDVFIGNILKCRPPGNRDPKPDEIIIYKP